MTGLKLPVCDLKMIRSVPPTAIVSVAAVWCPAEPPYQTSGALLIEAAVDVPTLSRIVNVG